MPKKITDSSLLLALEALADPVRLSIIRMLSEKTLCVCNIHKPLKMSQPRVSRHLGLLKRAGLIECTRRGKWYYYKVTHGSIWTSIRHLVDKAGSISELKTRNGDCVKGVRK